MSMTAWRDTAYNESYQKTIRSLQRRRDEDASFSREDVLGVLGHLYIQEGNNQEGRGSLQDAVLQSTIDAHENFLASWKQESETSSL